MQTQNLFPTHLLHLGLPLPERYRYAYPSKNTAEDTKPYPVKDIIGHLSTKTITLERSQYLLLKGATDTNIYYVESGSLRIYVLDQDEEQIIRFGYKDSMIVALDSFLTGKPSAFYIQAIKKAVVKVVTKHQLEAFLQQDTDKQWWTRSLEDLVLQQMEREVDILTSAPQERYRRVLQRSPQLFQEIPHRYIANYLRMTPETLSRLKKLDLDQDL